jgi:hypothetical protein
VLCRTVPHRIASHGTAWQGVPSEASLLVGHLALPALFSASAGACATAAATQEKDRDKLKQKIIKAEFSFPPEISPPVLSLPSGPEKRNAVCAHGDGAPARRAAHALSLVLSAGLAGASAVKLGLAWLGGAPARRAWASAGEEAALGTDPRRSHRAVPTAP